MNILFFGDSNTHAYIDCKSHVERHPGLMIDSTFWFLLETALDEDLYTKVVICIGSNHAGATKDELNVLYNTIRAYTRVIIVGPYGDIDTRNLDTVDGVHYSESAKKTISEKLKLIL